MEKKQPSLKLNMIMNGVLTMSSILFPLITFPYVSRVLLPVGNGKLQLASSVAMYFAMFAQLGIPTYGVRACAKVRDDKKELSRVVHELLAISLGFTVITLFFYAIAIINIPKFAEEKSLYIVMGSTIVLSTIGVEWLYKALEKYAYITIRSVIFKLIAVVAMFALVKTEEDYVIYGAISVFASSASYVLNFINLRKYVYVKPVGQYNCSRHMKQVFVFFFMSVATIIYTNLDNVMLGFMIDDEAVGIYSAAVKVKVLLVSLVTSAGTVLLPRASYYIDKGMNDEFKRIIEKTIRFVLTLSIPCTVYFMLYAEEGILLLSGKDFADSAIPMIIIMPTLILIGLTNVIGIQMLVPLGREKDVLRSEIAGAITDLILNLIFIPILGVAGAALGTLAAELVVLIWQLAVCKEAPKPYKVAGQVVIYTAVATAAAALVKLAGFGTVATLIASAAIFGLVYMILARKLLLSFR